MSLHRYIIGLALLALLVALFVPPMDSPETTYNEADCPFVATLGSPAAHVAIVAAPLLATPAQAAPLVHGLEVKWAPLPAAPRTAVVSLPIVLRVLLC
jgi:hypothetical protein